MKIIITGGTGQLGSELIRQIQGGRSALGTAPAAYEGAEILCPGRDVLDISDGPAAGKYIRVNAPDIVFHCAAMTNVDGCEDVPGQTMAMNGRAVEYIARACEAVGAKLVFISTDYVFDGKGTRPYVETDPTGPQGAYGSTKLAGEEFVKQFADRFFILRTAWLYGDGKNFVKTMLRLSENGGKVRVVGDQFGSPTSAAELARAIDAVLFSDNYGLFHATCEGSCNWADFAKEIFRLAGKDTEVEAITTEAYGAPAPRPAYSVLDNRMFRLTTRFSFADWHDALTVYLKELGYE